MRLFLILLCFAAQAIFADPASTVDKSKDGLTVQCAATSDIGIWAYYPANMAVSEAGGKLAIQLDLNFVKCANSAGTFAWITRLPYDPISRTVNGTVETTTVDQVTALIFDGSNFSRTDLSAGPQSTQSFNFSLDASAIDKEVAKLKRGEALVKTYYFAVENHEVNANGAAAYFTGGSYDIKLTWTKLTGTSVSLVGSIH
jgi:hypothetical protein